MRSVQEDYRGVLQTDGRLRDIATGAVLAAVVSLQLLQRLLNIRLGSSEWSWDVTEVWSRVAAEIASGTPLYVGATVDNKPPLWEFLMIPFLQQGPSAALLLAVSIANIALVFGVYILARRRYGYWIGFFTAMLLVSVLPSAGGLKFQPHNFAAALLVIGILVRSSIARGITLGTASLFVQYAGLALPAYLFHIYQRDGLTSRNIACFGVSIGVSVSIPFVAVVTIWGWDSLVGALYWTFAAPIGYVFGSGAAEPFGATSTQASLVHSPLFWSDLILEFVLQHVYLIVPALIAAPVVIRDGVERPELVYAVACGLLLLPLLIRAFNHYWLLPLPFLCLLVGSFLSKFTAQSR